MAIFRDSDRRLDARWATELQRFNVRVIEYGQTMNTEQAIFHVAPDDHIDELLDVVQEFVSEPTLMDHLVQTFPNARPEQSFADWTPVSIGEAPYRERLANLAISKSWFKTEARGRDIAPIVARIQERALLSPLAQCLHSVEQWLYD
ncbi:hypothetical protein D9M68_850680 [compost metagenome]